MKKLNVILLVVVFAISSFAKAETEPIKKREHNLANEIKELLKQPSFLVNNELMAYVTFTVNKEKEIVVLSVDSDCKMVENYIKTRLNYQKVNIKLNSNIKKYKMPVRIVEE